MSVDGIYVGDGATAANLAKIFGIEGAGNSFVPRLEVKGMNLVGVVSWSSRIRCRWSDVPEGGNSAFRFFTVEVELP